MKQAKSPYMRMPLCPPPPESVRNARGLELRKLPKRFDGEDQGVALARAKAMTWGSRIAEERVWWAKSWWIFLVHKEVA